MSELDSVLEIHDHAYRALTGFSGTMGSLKWEAFYQYGRVKSDVFNYGMYFRSRFDLVVDAVTAPSGEIVCRSTLIDAGNGCVPLNPFGEGSPSPESIAYVTGGVNGNHATVVDQTAGASISGPL